MSDAPIFDVDPAALWRDPYPIYRQLRAESPIAFVPQLGATLITRRDDIAVCEKNIEVFSSDQPDGLMTRLMGQNMMRKDGQAHRQERRIYYRSISPRTVLETWLAEFRAHTERVLDELAPKAEADLVCDYAMPVSAEALKSMTGLTNMHFADMDRASQGMIDGISNYTGDAEVEARCHRAIALVDAAIDDMLPVVRQHPNSSLLSVMLAAGMPVADVRANIRLTISGGQNEPRDAIAGCIFALLTHPEQLARVRRGEASWLAAFEEYCRWISPIGMSPRRIAREHTFAGVTFEPEDRIFFMFGAANHDADHFPNPERFDVGRDLTKTIVFGAGPHFCAGAPASRALVADCAVPAAFEHLTDLTLDAPDATPFGGWAFRGPLELRARWRAAQATLGRA